MPRKDRIHQVVKTALAKAGWTITHDPFRIHYADVDVYADLRVEKADGERGVRRALIIEIKTFDAASAVQELEGALGQYAMYRTFLQAAAADEPIYLAISDAVYQSLFTRQSFELIVRVHQIALLIVSETDEEIVRWIDSAPIGT